MAPERATLPKDLLELPQHAASNSGFVWLTSPAQHVVSKHSISISCFSFSPKSSDRAQAYRNLLYTKSHWIYQDIRWQKLRRRSQAWPRHRGRPCWVEKCPADVPRSCTLCPLDTWKISLMFTYLFGGLTHRTARPKFQLSRTQISIYIPPKLWWEFWKSKERKAWVSSKTLVCKLHTINTCDICHKLLGDYIWIFFTLCKETTSTTHEVTEPRSFVSQIANSSNWGEDVFMLDYR